MNGRGKGFIDLHLDNIPGESRPLWFPYTNGTEIVFIVGGSYIDGQSQRP